MKRKQQKRWKVFSRTQPALIFNGVILKHYLLALTQKSVSVKEVELQWYFLVKLEFSIDHIQARIPTKALWQALEIGSNNTGSLHEYYDS
jgi:uncharacterized membrane protein